MTAKLLMMDFKIHHGTAELAVPAVAAQYAFAQFVVFASCKPDRHLFRTILIHCAFPFTNCTNACL